MPANKSCSQFPSKDFDLRPLGEAPVSEKHTDFWDLPTWTSNSSHSSV